MISFDPFKEIGTNWMLITSGDKHGYNTMTASYGQMGVLWNRNVATIYVRPQRYTNEFIEDNEYFTLSFFTEEYRDALSLCGKMSGREGNKIEMAKLTPIVGDKYVTFDEAKTTFICKKIYTHRIEIENFNEKEIATKFPEHDFHIAYIGEIINVIAK